MSTRIDVPKDEIAAFCRRNHIRRLALFGSVLRDDFTPESDVDVIVDFEPGQTPGAGVHHHAGRAVEDTWTESRYAHFQGGRKQPQLAAPGGDTQFGRGAV